MAEQAGPSKKGGRKPPIKNEGSKAQKDKKARGGKKRQKRPEKKEIIGSAKPTPKAEVSKEQKKQKEQNKQGKEETKAKRGRGQREDTYHNVEQAPRGRGADDIRRSGRSRVGGAPRGPRSSRGDHSRGYGDNMRGGRGFRGRARGGRMRGRGDAVRGRGRMDSIRGRGRARGRGDPAIRGKPRGMRGRGRGDPVRGIGRGRADAPIGRGRGDAPRGRGRGMRARGGRGRGLRVRGRGRGRPALNVQKNTRKFSTIKFCCGSKVDRSEYFKVYSKHELNLIQIEPRLEAIGPIIEGLKFSPDRRGVSQIHTVCNTKQIERSMSAIEKFIKMISIEVKKLPIRVTCRINSNSSMHHWHIHYNRDNWVKMIEKNKELNIYARDINSKDEFLKLIQGVDVFKYLYAKTGFDKHYEQVAKLSIKYGGVDNDDTKDETNDNNNNEPIQTRKEIEEVIQYIKKADFSFSQYECRLWRKMKMEKNNKYYINKELLSVYGLTKKLKEHTKSDLFFKDMRFGIDFESKSIFIEIRPTAYFLIFDGKLKTFLKKFRSTALQRLSKWENGLISYYGKECYNSQNKYCQDYFKNHPELFDWHINRH